MTPPAALRPLFSTALLAVVFAGSPVGAADPSAAPQPAKPSVSTHATPAPGQPRTAPVPKAESTPTWAALSPAQKQALEPLAGTWSRLSEGHKRKWIAVSANYPTMPPGEQARLHTRMAEWAALSPQQRTQARQNFFEAQTLPADNKRAKWEAYQALPPEEKKKLAAGAGKPVPATAAAVQPSPEKLATVPKPKKSDARTPRIAGAPDKIDHNTLLPQQGTLPKQP